MSWGENWESRLERREAELDALLDQMDDRLDTALGEKGSVSPAHGFRPGAMPSAGNSTGEWNAVTRHWAGLFVQDRNAYFTGTDAEMQQICAYVLNAPHVTGNAHYARTARQTAFVYESGESLINAYATHGRSGRNPEIRVFGGALAFARLCGALRVLCDDGSRQQLNAAWPLIGKAIIEGGGHLAPADTWALLQAQEGDRFWTDETLVRRALSHASGMIGGIIAHELGHLALGHTLGQAANLEVSRNQEREADSFASSVISTSVFSDPLVEGMLLWELAWVWSDYAGGREVATTHPLSRERLLDFIRANETIARGLGIALDSIQDLLPG